MQTVQVPTTDGRVATVTHLTRDDWGAGPVFAGHEIDSADVIAWALHHVVFILQDWDGDGIRHGDLDDIIRYMRTLQTSRPDLNSEVPYSVVVFAGVDELSAVICDGRGEGRSGAHTACHNHEKYAWSIGSNTEDEPVTPGMVAAMRWIAGEWTPHVTEPTIGHKDHDPCMGPNGNYHATGCPGPGGDLVLPDLQPPFVNDPSFDPNPTPEFEEHLVDPFIIQHGSNNALIADGRMTKISDDHVRQLVDAGIVGQERIVVSVDDYKSYERSYGTLKVRGIQD